MTSYITPNETIRDTDSHSIQAAITRAIEAGCGKVRIPRKNERTGAEQWIIEETVFLPSNIELWIDDAHLILAENRYLNMFITGKAGDPTETKNVTLRGTGRATLDGGVYNGLSEKNSMTEGRPHISKNTTLLFFNTSNLTVENLRLINQRWWAITNIFVHHSTFRNLSFEADFSRIDENGIHHADQLPLTYREIYVRNADGIDLRIGCHDILIENISGFTEDDSVALTALGGFERKLGFVVKDASPDIHDVVIRNVSTETPCANVRLLNDEGNCLYNILVDGVTSLRSLENFRANAAVRIGDIKYAKNHSSLGDTHHITVRNVISNATRGVSLCKGLCNSTIENITALYGVGISTAKNSTATLKHCGIHRVLPLGKDTVAIDMTGITVLE